MAFLGIQGRMPSPEEARVFNALLVTRVEHGMAMTSRLIYLTSPEALQTAVAVGLCGVGSVFAGGSEQVAKVLQDTSRDARAQPDLQALARRVVDEHAERKQPGIGQSAPQADRPATRCCFPSRRKADSSDAMSCFWRRFAPKPRPGFNVRCRSMPQGIAVTFRGSDLSVISRRKCLIRWREKSGSVRRKRCSIIARNEAGRTRT